MNGIHISRRRLLAAALGTVGAATVPSGTRGAPPPTAPAPGSAPPRHLPIHETTVTEIEDLTRQFLHREEVLHREEGGHASFKLQVTQRRWIVNAVMEQLAFSEGAVLPLPVIIAREYPYRPLRIPTHWRLTRFPGLFEAPYRSFRQDDDGYWRYDPTLPPFREHPTGTALKAAPSTEEYYDQGTHDQQRATGRVRRRPRLAHRQGRDASGYLPPTPGTKTGAQDER